MENLKKIQQKIDLEKEIITATPKKTKKNQEEYLEKVKSAQTSYQQLLERINQILESRYNYYCGFKKNQDIDKLEEQIRLIAHKIDLFDTNNSPYEKTGLDRLIYDIGKYYKSNFEKVTKDIEEVVTIFEKVGAKLTKSDFVYSDYVKEYMVTFFNEKGDPHSSILKKTFERIYWQKPDIIKYIQYNFRYLYYQNETKFYEYIRLEKEKHLAELGDEGETLKLYTNMKERLSSANSLDKQLILQKFVTTEFKIEDYSEKKLNELYKQITMFNGDKNSLDSAIKKLNETLFEYKNYMNYRFLIDNVIEVYRYDEKTKIDSKAKLKEISNAEENIIGKRKNWLLLSLKKRGEIVTIDKIQELYAELDEIIFREKVKEFISDGSKIIDALRLATSYYIIAVKLIKNKYSEIDQDKANNIYDELRPFLLTQKNTLINNLNLFQDYDMPMIISDKYALDNLNIDKEMLSDKKIDELIKIVKKIIVAINLRNVKGLSIAEINEFIELEKRIKQKAEKS